MTACYIRSAFSYTTSFDMVLNNLPCSIIKILKHTLSSNETFICFLTIIATYIMNICALPLQYVKTLISLPFTLIVMLHLFYQLFNHYHRCTTIIKNKTHIFLLECDVNVNYISSLLKQSSIDR